MQLCLVVFVVITLATGLQQLFLQGFSVLYIVVIYQATHNYKTIQSHNCASHALYPTPNHTARQRLTHNSSSNMQDAYKYISLMFHAHILDNK